MCNILAAAGLAAAAGVSPRGAGAEAGLRECALNGVALLGDVEVVDSFPGFKIQYVDSFPDLKIEAVDSFPGVP